MGANCDGVFEIPSPNSESPALSSTAESIGHSKFDQLS